METISFCFHQRWKRCTCNGDSLQKEWLKEEHNIIKKAFYFTYIFPFLFPSNDVFPWTLEQSQKIKQSMPFIQIRKITKIKNKRSLRIIAIPKIAPLIRPSGPVPPIPPYSSSSSFPSSPPHRSSHFSSLVIRRRRRIPCPRAPLLVRVFINLVLFLAFLILLIQFMIHH